MKIRIKPISPVQNRDYGKRKELEVGQARMNTLRIRVFSKEETEKLTVADLVAPPEEATIEVLWHDHATRDKLKRWVREHPDHQLVE